VAPYLNFYINPMDEKIQPAEESEPAAKTEPTVVAEPIVEAAPSKPPRKPMSIVLGVIVGLVISGIVVGAGAILLWKFYSPGGDDTDADSEEDVAEDEVTDEGDTEDDTDVSDGTDTDADADPDPDVEPELSEATDDDPWLFPAGIFDTYTYVRYICDGYAGMDPDLYFMDVEYSDSVIVTTDWRGVGSLGECDLQFAYGDSYMHLQFNVGEAYPRTIDAGYEELLTVDGSTLIRTAMTLSGGEYSYSYMVKQADADCVPNVFDPELAPPCALPVHPFLPGATMVGVSIPETTGLSERGDIVDLFDDIAKRMHGDEN
jgi:hypothetical protein